MLRWKAAVSTDVSPFIFTSRYFYSFNSKFFLTVCTEKPRCILCIKLLNPFYSIKAKVSTFHAQSVITCCCMERKKTKKKNTFLTL